MRALRRRENLTQVQLAERLGISPSYLNLIENNRRPLTGAAPHQARAALPARPRTSFGGDDDARPRRRPARGLRRSALRGPRAARTPTCASSPSTRPTSPARCSRSTASYQSARESAATPSPSGSRKDDGHAGSTRLHLPSEEVSDLIQRHMNHFPELEEAAEELWRDARLDAGDALRRARRATSTEAHGVARRASRASATSATAVRRFDPEKRRLTLSEVLPPRSRTFQLAHQIGAPHAAARVFDRDRARRAPHDAESRALARVALANYFAGAVLMPYAPLPRGRARPSATTSSCSATASARASSRSATASRRCGGPGAEGVPVPHDPHRRRRQHLQALQRDRASASRASAARARGGTSSRRS